MVFAAYGGFYLIPVSIAWIACTLIARKVKHDVRIYRWELVAMIAPGYVHFILLYGTLLNSTWNYFNIQKGFGNLNFEPMILSATYVTLICVRIAFAGRQPERARMYAILVPVVTTIVAIALVFCAPGWFAESHDTV